jgi:hypothetical protein
MPAGSSGQFGPHCRAAKGNCRPDIVTQCCFLESLPILACAAKHYGMRS